MFREAYCSHYDDELQKTENYLHRRYVRVFMLVLVCIAALLAGSFLSERLTRFELIAGIVMELGVFCLWEIGCGVVFHAPEVVQERNAHNLMKDFTDEIPGYTGNRKLTEVLENTPLLPGENNMSANLLHCYEALIAAGFFPPEELQLVKLWLADIAVIL